MKDCKKIHPLLPLYRENQLSAREIAAVEKHLSGCPAAREELKQLESLSKAFKSVPEPKMPRDLHDKIMARLHGKPSAVKPFWPRASWGLAAAAGLAFIFCIQNFDWLGNRNSEVVLKTSSPLSLTGPRGSANTSSEAGSSPAAKAQVETNIALKPQQNLPANQPVTEMGLDKNLSADANVPQAAPSQAVAQAQISLVTRSTDLALAPQERNKKMKMDMAKDFQVTANSSDRAAAAPQASFSTGANDTSQAETKLGLNYQAILPNVASAQLGDKQTPKFMQFDITGINSGQYQVNWQTDLVTKGQIYVLDSTGNTLQAIAENTQFAYDHQIVVDTSKINTGFFVKVLAGYLNGNQAVTVSNVLNPQ